MTKYRHLNSLCPSCKLAEETIAHMLFFCPTYITSRCRWMKPIYNLLGTSCYVKALRSLRKDTTTPIVWPSSSEVCHALGEKLIYHNLFMVFRFIFIVFFCTMWFYWPVWSFMQFYFKVYSCQYIECLSFMVRLPEVKMFFDHSGVYTGLQQKHTWLLLLVQWA